MSYSDYVYAIQRNNGLIKIGVSFYPELRYRTLCAQFREVMKRIGMVGVRFRSQEQELHRLLSDHLAPVDGKEWYFPTPVVLQAVGMFGQWDIMHYLSHYQPRFAEKIG